MAIGSDNAHPPVKEMSAGMKAYMRWEIGLLLSDALEGYEKAAQGIRDATSNCQRLCWVIALAQYTACVANLEQGLKRYGG